MVWGKASDSEDHQRRGKALTQAAYRGPEGMPVYDRPGMRGGSRGGTPIWVMREAWMPAGKPSRERIARLQDKRDLVGHALGPHEEIELMMNGSGDADGFAVFGRYPPGFLNHVLRTELLGTRRLETG